MESILKDRRVAFVGKLGGLTKREAIQLVRDHGGVGLERATQDVDLLIVGAEHPSDIAPLSLVDDEIRDRCEQGLIELLTETELWTRLGLVEQPTMVTQLYTPAMMAELLNIPVRQLRRWLTMGLLHPVRVVHRLPYFDWDQVQASRQISGWLQEGVNLQTIQKLQRELSLQKDPSVTLATVHVLVEGKQLLVRQERGLIEPSGQLRIDFESLEEAYPSEDRSPHPVSHVLPFPGASMVADPDMDIEMMLAHVDECEDAGLLQEAIEWYRAILARFGPRADVNFQLAELLYREGEVSAARERYFMAIELDEDYVEARANLGCVLAEMGQLDLAVAAFQGALAKHDAYPDVHYHLARALDDQGRTDEAAAHWERFLDLAPGSPWAEEARDRLQAST